VSPPALVAPQLDPSPIFEIFRGSYATDLLAAAVTHFQVFGCFGGGPLTFEELRRELALEERPARVLVTALRAFGLLVEDGAGRLGLSALARDHLAPDSAFDVSDYIALGADTPGVMTMVERLRSNRPAGLVSEEPGLAFVYREGLDSAMEKQAAARHLTLALAGRGRNVAPVLAERMPLDGARLLLDSGGGTGLYSVALLQKNPHLRAIVWDRPEVLKVAREIALAYGVADRLECAPADMFKDPVPAGVDTILLSNVLHDWDVPQCRILIGKLAAGLPSGGRLLIHDVFLNDALDGPLAVALYSAALFCVTEGRAYSAAEYGGWLTAAGLVPGAVVPTLIHCGVLPAVKAG
jgi:hypothetical protein